MARLVAPLALLGLLAGARAQDIAGLPEPAAELPDVAAEFEGDIAGLPDQDLADAFASLPEPVALPAPDAAGNAAGDVSVSNPAISTERQIDGVPSEGNYILAEQEMDLGWGNGQLEITSDLPVTVQRYYDGGRFLMGQQPVTEGYVKVLVTSDCDTNETDVVPDVEMISTGQGQGSVSVSVAGTLDEEEEEMEFLEPSSYEAFWTWFNDFCGGGGVPEPVPVVPVPVVKDGCEIGPGLDPTDVCGEGEFCQLPPGVCTVATRRERSLMPLPDDVWVGTCEIIPEACIEIYQPVCGCDGVTYENDCKAAGRGISVAYEGECRPASGAFGCPIAGQCPDPNGVCMPEVQCFANPCEVNPPCQVDEVCTANYCGGCHAVCAPASAEGVSCEVASSTPEKNSCPSDKLFCQVELGVCTGISGVLEGVCAFKPEACTLEYAPVCGCDGVTHSNACAARSNGASVSYPGACAPASADGACEVAPAYPEKNSCGSDKLFCQLEPGACRGSATNVLEGVCRPKPQACTMEYAPVCGCDLETYSNECSARSNGVSVSKVGECHATATRPTESLPTDQVGLVDGPEGTVASTTASSTSATLQQTGDPEMAATVASTTATVAASTTDGTSTTSTTNSALTTVAASTTDSATTTSLSTPDETTTAATNPIVATTTATESAVKSPTPAPTEWWEVPGATSPNSAFGHPRSFSFLAATALLAIVLCSIVFSGNADITYWAFGKFAVAALAVSAVYPKSGDSAQKTKNARAQPLSAQRHRAVQKTCTFNVEVLLDGCTHPLQISAPNSRIVDAKVESTSQQRPDSSCVTDYAANITFPTADGNVEDVPANGSVPAIPSFGPECLRAVAGRPFVDATGSSLVAMAMVPNDGSASAGNSALTWSGDAMAEHQAPSDCSAANHSHFVLGEDWIQRALGEHASVASFSAFSIALMSNRAPSDLVEAALKAGLDEVRHAKMSFDIASKLLGGKEVGPGPLPDSEHTFGQDLDALALAVAREGCLDETLSAFAAAMEAEHITEVIEKRLGDSPYSAVDPDLLALIKKELVTIALDESNHSALAWRTLTWACGVNMSVCRDVFGGGSVEKRISQRADNSFGEHSATAQRMRAEWNKIHEAFAWKMLEYGPGNDPAIQSICEMPADGGGDYSGAELVSAVTDNIRRQLLCD